MVICVEEEEEGRVAEATFLILPHCTVSPANMGCPWLLSAQIRYYRGQFLENLEGAH